MIIHVQLDETAGVPIERQRAKNPEQKAWSFSSPRGHTRKGATFVMKIFGGSSAARTVRLSVARLTSRKAMRADEHSSAFDPNHAGGNPANGCPAAELRAGTRLSLKYGDHLVGIGTIRNTCRNRSSKYRTIRL